MHRIRALLVVSLALLGSMAISACGDDDGGGDEDPAAVLEATFENDEKVTSGAFDLSVDLDVEGGDDSGTFEATLSGPFQGEEGAVPKFDVDAEVKSDTETQDFSGDIGLTSTGDKAFLSFQGTDYEVPADAFNQFAQTYVQAQEQGGAEDNFLPSIGVDPTNWLTDLENEGTEDVEGTETIHIKGSADTPKLVEDVKKIAENAPAVAGQQATPDQIAELDQLAETIESAEFDVYTGADDDLLRKIEGNFDLNPDDVEGAPDSVALTFSLTLSELNEPQSVSAPAGAQPLGDLLEQFGVDPSQLGAALQGAGGAPPQAGGSPQAPSNSSTDAYLECLRSAQGEEATQACSSLLQ